MKRLFAHRWLGMGLLGYVMVLGCSQAQHRCPCCFRSQPIGGVAMHSAPVTTTETVVVAAPAVVKAPQVVQAAPEVKSEPVVTPEAVPVPPPVVKLPEPVKEVVQTGYALPLSGGKEDPVRRRTFADITANPAFAHAPDYSWLTGELQFLHVRTSWRVRYASVDEEDRYGGSVTLSDVGSMTEYQNGQIVRVEGQLIDPESREPSPPYRVYRIQAVSP